MRFELIKNYFDNGFKTWDGWKCPECTKIFSPDRLLSIQDVDHESDRFGLVCPGCYCEQD